LLFDAKKNRIKSQVVCQLVEAAQGRSWCR